MRPLSLHITAFGPFPSTEVIDFSALNAVGLFVIAGPTGSGKTTIFDALTYALYGVVPGQRDPNEMHSHHAAGGSTPEVRLDFEVGAERYRAVRSPGHSRPKRRGAGIIDVAPTAALLRLVDGEWRPVCEAKPRVVSEFCADLIGLSDVQFHRVVLLPQGQFERFLVAKGDDRRPLLRQVFGTGIFDRAVERLKIAAVGAQREADLASDRAARAREQVELAVLRARRAAGLDPHGADPADPADPADALGEVEVVAARLAEELAAVAADADEVAAEAATADDIARRWRVRAARLRRRSELEAERDQRSAERRLLERARRAAPVVDAGEVAGRAVQEEAAAMAAFAAHHLDVTQVISALGHDADTDPRRLREALAADMKHADALVVQRRRVATLAEALETERWHESSALAAVVSAEASLDEARALLVRYEVEIAALDPLADGLAEAEAALEVAGERLRRRTTLDELAEQVARLEADADVADREYRAATQAFLSTAAPRLAQHLVPGQPCAVCGSPEHPAPAQPSLDFALVSADRLDVLRDATAAARARRDHALVSLRALTHVLGQVAGEALDTVADRLRAAEGRVRSCRAAIARRTEVAGGAVEQRAHIAAMERSLVTLHRDLATANERCRLAEKDYDEALFDLAGDGDRGDDPDLWKRSIAAALTGLDTSDDLWVEAQRHKAAASLARQSLTDAARSAGFVTVDEALGAALPTADLEERAARLAAWDAELAEIDAQLCADGGDLPDEEPRHASLRARAAQLARQRDEMQTRLAEVRAHVAAAGVALREAEALVASAPAIVAEAELAATVHARCAGQLSPRIPLENWVLSAELDRVADAANVHLGTMTSDRYQLARAHEVLDGRTGGGLDLLVVDAHTGTTRRTTSLSGGERFQASLALALGLADVVTSGTAATARTIDALFVDEGFGSLDADALDQAIGALDRLRRHGRLIGIITHVEAMKAALPVGIEVRRLPGARGSTIHQLVT